MSTHYDLVVIGSGPAGEKGAAQAAYFGKRVALVERAEHPGGAGINTGTVPSKTLRETALYFSGLRQRGLYGIDYSLKDGLTVADFMYRKQIVVENEWKIIGRNLERHEIEVVWGEASLEDAHTVHVRKSFGEELDLETDIILIATGSSPHHPDGIPFDHRLIYDSDSILHMSQIPKTMAVIGGGVIGCEYASIFTALGVNVTLVESRDRLLAFADGEIAGRLQKRLESLGLRFIFSDRVLKVETSDDHVHLALQGGEQLECDIALFAAGRQSNTQGLGLEAVGVQSGNRGLILVNEKYQTNVPNIYAAGDVIGFPALASTSMEQARVAMVHAFGLRYKEQVSPTLPLAIYTIPEISMVGLAEEECHEKKIPCLVGRAYYENNPRGQIIGDLSGMIKLVFSPIDKKLLGVHLIGEMSSELIHIGAQVMATDGTIDAFINAVYNYPTLADAYKYAAYDGLGAWERWQAAGKPQ
ncbi:MAG: Si-specific NAD(P)(+) transhydrogenase [Chloroflexi bacterium]|nr:Si-specific NAD(P)(+) transhydrogenase [Chloroflexota bacterium]